MDKLGRMWQQMLSKILNKIVTDGTIDVERVLKCKYLSLHEFYTANNILEVLKLYVSNSTFVGNYPEFCFTQSSV